MYYSTAYFLLITHTFFIHYTSVYIIHKFLEPSMYTDFTVATLRLYCTYRITFKCSTARFSKFLYKNLFNLHSNRHFKSSSSYSVI